MWPTRQSMSTYPDKKLHVQNIVNKIADAIKLYMNPNLLQQKAEEATGQEVTLKDISNTKQR